MNQTKSLLSSLSNQINGQRDPNELVRYVYAADGVGLFFEPYLYSEEATHIPMGGAITLMSLDYQPSFRYKWFKTTYRGVTVYVSEKYIGKFPVPDDNEAIGDYLHRIKSMNFKIEVESYSWEDRQEFKILFPSTNMREIFLIASRLYPIDFKFPKPSNKMEEYITKIDDTNDIYEEFEITRNKKGEVILLDYLADFGESSDSITIRKRSDDKILLIMGSYCQGYRKVNDNY